MDNPCKHCNKADIGRETLQKCDKPCRRYKDWYSCYKMLIDVLAGKVRI